MAGRACSSPPAGAALALSLPADPVAAPHLASRSLVEGLPVPTSEALDAEASNLSDGAC